MHHSYQRDNFTITTDPATLDIEVIHSYLVRSYWKRGVPKEHVARSLKYSLNFGLFDGNSQIGFARVVTDYTDFAYLCDVFILESYQGQGLGQWLMACILACPDLQGLGRFTLATRDAQEFYRKFGFEEVNAATNMQISARRPWYQPQPDQAENEVRL
jgi:GNAT superfamily N-acetyltransferase